MTNIRFRAIVEGRKTSNKPQIGKERNKEMTDTKPTSWKKYIITFAIVLLWILLFGAIRTEAATPYGSNGQLSVSGSKIVNAKGKTFVIKGVSTHGLSWYPEYVTKASFKSLRDDWGVNTVRLALYTAEYNGYCTGGNQTQLKKLIDNGVQYATDLGMYVIIDWHILSDGNPLTYKSQSLKFFKEIAKKYASYGNVLYEICNEPNGSGGSWKNIKSYAASVIKTIRSVNAKAIIIVGTPTWSQDVDTAAADPITGYKNIAYAFHFYAGTHKDSLRSKLESAIKKGLPVLVTEFGISEASGNGTANTSEGNKWIKLLDQYSVGRVAWNLSNKNETSALLKSSCTKKSGWSYSDLSASGKWLVGVYQGKLAAKSATSTPTPTPTKKATPTPTPKATKKTTPTPTPKATKKATPTPTPKAIKKATPTPTPKASGTTTNKTITSTGTVKLTATLKKSNSWKSNGKYYTQYTLTIKNSGSKKASKWTVAATFGATVKLTDKWCAGFTSSKTKLTIKPLSWNTALTKGESTEIGFIMESSKAQTIKTLTISAS
jgi:endoglucanase